MTFKTHDQLRKMLLAHGVTNVTNALYYKAVLGRKKSKSKKSSHRQRELAYAYLKAASAFFESADTQEILEED